MKMTAVTAVQFVLMMTICASLAVVSEGVSRESCLNPSVAPKQCEVCIYVEDHELDHCCAWCLAHKRDIKDELGADEI